MIQSYPLDPISNSINQTSNLLSLGIFVLFIIIIIEFIYLYLRNKQRVNKFFKNKTTRLAVIISLLVLIVISGFVLSNLINTNQAPKNSSADSLRIAGGSCNQTADCATPKNGGVAICSGETCQNSVCIGNTIAGANYDCAFKNTCGSPCSASLGTCQSGSTCKYVVGSACTITSSTTPTTYCIPDTPTTTGWATAACVSADTGNSYATLNGVNPTAAQIAQACNPIVSSSSSSVSSATGNVCGPIDVTGLGVLDIVDFTAFAQKYGSTCGDNYPLTMGCGGKDTNLDGIINITDLTKFAKFYGQNCLGMGSSN